MKTATCFLALVSAFILMLLPAALQADQIVIHGPSGSGGFGNSVVVLPSGNIVVPDQFYSPGGTPNVGAVSLYGPDGTLISTVTGSSAGDSVGSGGITVLSNGNFVISSPAWNNGGVAAAGAVTWCSGTTGLSGAVSATNSLVGTSANDQISTDPASQDNLVRALPNGNYVVCSPGWHNAGVAGAGAVTWGNGTTGTTGAVSAANSLVGSTANDDVGNGIITILTNGNYVVLSPFWHIGANSVGAATWCNGATGLTGAVSTSNSLYGSTDKDWVGYGGVAALSNGNYAVISYFWSNGASTSVGAVTWGSGTTGITGAVSTSNSLYGNKPSDNVGIDGAKALTNGNYVVVSSDYHHSGNNFAGAVTWCNGSAATAAVVSGANSLTGSSANDSVGSGGVTALNNGNYVVASPDWNNGGTASVGAVTWGGGTAGVIGSVSSANSLIGGTASDMVGSFGITALNNGNYVVSSPSWDSAVAVDAGAVTWGSGTTGVSGLVSSSNSLTGSTQGDAIGAVTALTNGNFVVSSSNWTMGGVANVGIATWVNGATGATGPVSAIHSLVGSDANSYTGEVVTALANGNYVVRSASFSGSLLSFPGAVTWCSGTAATTGVVSAANSLVGGSDNDGVGGGGIVPLPNGNYVVCSPDWTRGTVSSAGAVTWCDGTTSTAAAVSAANSLVGSSEADSIGDGFVTALSDSRYAILSNAFTNTAPSAADAGAVTLGFGATGNVGRLSGYNGVLGTVPNVGPTLVWGYDAVRGQLAVGSINTESVTLFTPTPEIELVKADGTFVSNGDSVDFGTVTTSSSASLTFTLNNPGLGDLTGLGTSFSGAAGSDLTVTTSPAAPLSGPRGTTTITIQFSPGAAGLRQGTLSIASNDSDNTPFVLNLFGTGTAPQISVAQGTTTFSSGDSKDFGSVNLGISAPLTFTVSNAGSGSLGISSINVSGGNAGDFSVNTTGTQLSLANGGSTTFSVSFSPGAVGSRSTTLQIASNDASTPTFSVSLTGTGIAAVPGTIAFANPVEVVDQGATTVALVVNRTGGTAATSVTIKINNGTASTVPPFSAAVAPTDFTALTGAATTVSFASGDTTKTVNVTLIPKVGTTIPNKRFTATLSAPTGGASLGAATTTVQILAADTVKPTLTVTSPTTRGLSTTMPVTVTGVAGDAHGIAQVTVALNGHVSGVAVLGAATSPTAVPYSIVLGSGDGLLAGANTLVATASDLRGNSTSVTVNFTYVQRYLLTVARSVPAIVSTKPDNAGTVAMTPSPATSATALTPTTANTDPKTSQVLPATSVKLTATAKAGYVFSSWSGLPGTAVTLGNVTTFTMPAANTAVTAVFVATPFGGPAGEGTGFSGLVHASGGTVPSNATEGFISGTLSTTGAFSGKLLLNGLTEAFVATFFGDGSSAFTVGTTTKSSFTFGTTSLTLSYNTATDLITANVATGENTSTGTAARALYSAAHKVPAAASLLNAATTGYYTVSLPSISQTPPVDVSTYPQGDGYATLTLTNLGAVSGTLTLADGSVATVSAALVAGNACPFFVQLVTPGAAATVKGGSFGGTLAFLSQTDSDVTGTDLLWFRPTVTAITHPVANPATELYTAGWPLGIHSNAVGALYFYVETVQTALQLPVATAATANAELSFTAGKLTAPVNVKTFNITKNTVTKIPATDASYTITLSYTTGLFSGAFTPNWASPSTTKPAYKGVILQKGLNRGGFGFFISNAVGDLAPQSGGVTLGPLTVVQP